MIFAVTPALPPTAAVGASITLVQQQIIERIKQQQSNNKQFGECSYSWDSWKLSPDGVRTTKRQCRQEVEALVAVSCPILKTNSIDDGKWGEWRSPLAPNAKQGEELMVAALCANIAQSPAPAN